MNSVTAAPMGTGVRATNSEAEGAREAQALPSIDIGIVSRMTAEELDALYRNGKVPHIPDLDGTPKGRMLALVGPLGRGPAARALRAFAASKAFPWGGKSFTSMSSTAGRGINRAIVLGEVFPFDTRIEPSVVDGKPAVILDYDKPENPWFIRKIHDELRQVGKTTYIGPAMWKTATAPVTVLYFAIQVA